MQDDLEQVPLSPAEKTNIVEAWLSYIHALPETHEPSVSEAEKTTLFTLVVNDLLEAHGFERSTGELRWTAGGEVEIVGRKARSRR